MLCILCCWAETTVTAVYRQNTCQQNTNKSHRLEGLALVLLHLCLCLGSQLGSMSQPAMLASKEPHGTSATANSLLDHHSSTSNTADDALLMNGTHQTISLYGHEHTSQDTKHTDRQTDRQTRQADTCPVACKSSS